jgi:hypothetical protein
MFDGADTTSLIQKLAAIDLKELRELHGRITDAETVVRAVIRQREAQERRDERLRARGLSIVRIAD